MFLNYLFPPSDQMADLTNCSNYEDQYVTESSHTEFSGNLWRSNDDKSSLVFRSPPRNLLS